jgi:FixJ family two-component response regulator
MAINAIVIDDDEPAHENLTRFFEANQQKYNLGWLKHARDFEEAIPLLEQFGNTVNIIFLDIQLSQPPSSIYKYKNGLDLGEMFILHKLPARIVFTISDSNLYHHDILTRFGGNAGGIDLLKQPFTDKQVEGVIERYNTHNFRYLETTLVDLRKVLCFYADGNGGTRCVSTQFANHPKGRDFLTYSLRRLQNEHNLPRHFQRFQSDKYIFNTDAIRGEIARKLLLTDEVNPNFKWEIDISAAVLARIEDFMAEKYGTD